jgi:hypothetical protein
MEPFASAGLSKPTGFNNTKPTWSHIEETDTPDDFDFSVAVATGNDKEGNTDEDIPNVGPPYFSSFEILVQLLINSDLPAKIAIFQLLLDQRCSVPLLVSHSQTYYTHFKTEQIIHRLRDGLSCLGDVLDFVTVKLANQEILSISEDRILPRVVFVSDRKVLSSRETPDMASDVMNCQFISKHIKSDTGDGPIVEVGVGFLATPGDEARKYMPCLVLCVWGDHDQLGEFLEKVADIVIVETDPTQEPRVLSWAGEHQHVLYWNINSTGRRSSNKNGKDMICGSFKNLTRYIGKSLMNEISKKKFKGSKGVATSLRECLPRQIQLSNPKVPTSNVPHLDGTNLERVRDGFLLQKSFAREAKIFFESLRLKGQQAELKQRQNQIQQEKKYRASVADNVMRLPILAGFIQLLKEKNYLKRKIGIVQFELSINKKLQPTLEKAAKKVDDAFDAFQQQPENLELKQMYYCAKGEHVDQMLGLEHLWRELSHMFAADPSTNRDLPMLAAQHLVDGFPLEILDGDVAMFHKLWVVTVLVELNKCLHAVLERDPKVLVLSIIGVQSSGKSTLLNLMFGTQLKTSAGQCTCGVYLQVVKSEWSDYDYVLLLETEGIRAPEYFGLEGAELHDNRLATFTVLPADACIVMVANEEDSGLKEVLPMAMLAFKESAMAEEHGGQMQAKLFFVYRSVDTNDTKKLLMNQRKLQEDLRRASHEIANLQINEVEEGGSQVRQPPSTLDSLQNFRIDLDEENSDVKFFGNVKKSNVPPFDVPDDEYGNKVVKLRKYINNRVLHGGWESHGLKAWTKYLCMVWECIADTNFELGFLNHIEYAHYQELQTKLARCRQIVGHKWLEELEILEGTLQGAIRSNLEMSAIGLMQTLKSKVEDTIKEETRKVNKILQQKQCQKWKVEETSCWGDFCSDQKRQWMRRLDDCVDGVVKFDSVVKDYNNKIRVKIELDAKRYSEDLTAKDRQTKMKGHFENNIFKRILLEAEEKCPSEEPTIPERVLVQYQKHLVVGRRNFFTESEFNSSMTKYCTTFVQSMLKRIPGQKPIITEEEHIYNELITKVESCLEGTKQYADHLVLEVIQLTETLTEREGKIVKHNCHNLAKDVLTQRLKVIQHEWNKHHNHNVAKRLETEHARLWQFFQNCANHVGGTKVFSDEVVNLLNNNLLESFKILLTKRVCDQLQGEAWVTNWRVMKAHLDLHLVNLIEEGNIDELLTCVANGSLHHERVVGIQIQEALNKTLEQNQLWSWFVEEVKLAVQLSASAARVQNALQKSILFHDSLKELLCKTSPELAKNISLVDVYSQVEDVIDFSAVGQKVGEEINNLQPNLTSSISELVQKVKSRMIICESESARPRCEHMCPLCALTCIYSSGHSGKHDTVHQPQGLASFRYSDTKILVPESCTKCVALPTEPTFRAPKSGIDSSVPYKEFEKHFPQWVLPTQFSSSGPVKLREYIFAHYQEALVQKYAGTKICPYIPTEYKNHNLKELRHELENNIALNS